MPLSRDDIASLLGEWSRAQALPDAALRGAARFVVESQTLSTEAVGRTAREILAVALYATPLFENAKPPLDAFTLLSIPGTGRPDRVDLFDVAAVLSDGLAGANVEPDLGANHFDWDGDQTGDARLESADHAFWCWAPVADDPARVDWALEMICAEAAWQTPGAQARRGHGIRVFQPDTGVVRNHPELPSKCWGNADARNFVEPDQPPIDPMGSGSNPGHGTATGSVVASPATVGMLGSAPDCTLVPLRALTSVAVFDQSPVAQAIDHARRTGAHVITMSLGGVPSAALHAAVKAAVRDNVILLAAAGNCVGEVVFPARYPEMIALGGVNQRGEPWRGSSRGPSVAVAAPAEFVPCADAGEFLDLTKAVRTGQGTSFATALTAGVAACWLSHHGRDHLISVLPVGRTLQEMLRNLLRASARPLAAPDVSGLGAGVVDAAALLAQDPKSAFSPALDSWAPPGGSILDLLSGLIDGLSRIQGLEGAPLVARADPRKALECASLALDAARFARTRRMVLEGAPPLGVSRALADALVATH